MINSANKYSVADIFMPDNQAKYVIPKFQREYTWNKENWDELLSDILESDGNHFIGSIICINKGTDTLKPELELIDGQQRLTTISLLFCAIYKLLKNVVSDDNDEIKTELYNLSWRLVQKRDRGKKELKLELSHQNNNFNDYKSVLKEIGIIDFENETRNKGNRRIYKTFRFFLSRLEGKSTDDLIDLLNKVNSTLLVKIEVNSHSDAFLLFESLNNRGVPLSAIDLIKNKMLAELEKKDIMPIDLAFDKWNVIIKNLPEYPIQERFLRQLYNAFKYKSVIKVEKITKATKSTLIKIYETLIENQTDFIFKELMEKSSIYKDLVMPGDSEDGIFSELENELVDLVNVKAAPSYVLLLYLFSLENKPNVNFYKEVINFLVKYFVRRNITDFPNTRNLDQIFMNLIEELEQNKENVSAELIIKYLSADERMSNIADFQKKLSGDVYELNVDATRFILSKIEETRSTNEIHTDFWERDKSGKLVWTIEHIFPEGSNIPDSWVQMIANGDKAEAASIQEKYVHKIGNLTLTGYNQNLSNFDFTKKRDRKDTRDNFIGYKNKLFLNEDLKDRSEWGKEDIIKRTEKLVGIASGIFKIGNE